MNLNRVLIAVPRVPRRISWLLGGGIFLAGLILAQWAGGRSGDPHATLVFSVAALVLGLIVATWILAIGFVYADAQARGMRAGLWVALVILVPHLLGFLLYFVLRQPFAVNCAHCGQRLDITQRFCPWCGVLQPRFTASEVPPPVLS